LSAFSSLELIFHEVIHPGTISAEVHLTAKF